MALTINFNAEAPSCLTVYGRTDEELNATGYKLLTDIQAGLGTSNLTEEDKENLVILMNHRAEQEAQVAAMLILGEAKTLELVRKINISYLVEALLPHKDRYAELAAFALAMNSTERSDIQVPSGE